MPRAARAQKNSWPSRVSAVEETPMVSAVIISPNGLGSGESSDQGADTGQPAASTSRSAPRSLSKNGQPHAGIVIAVESGLDAVRAGLISARRSNADLKLSVAHGVRVRYRGGEAQGGDRTATGDHRPCHVVVLSDGRSA